MNALFYILMIPSTLCFMYLFWFLWTLEKTKVSFSFSLFNFFGSALFSFFILSYVDDDNIGKYKEHKIVTIISAKNSNVFSLRLDIYKSARK